MEKDNCLLWKGQQIGLWLLTLSAAQGSTDGGASIQPSAMLLPSRGGWQMLLMSLAALCVPRSGPEEKKKKKKELDLNLKKKNKTVWKICCLKSTSI